MSTVTADDRPERKEPAETAAPPAVPAAIQSGRRRSWPCPWTTKGAATGSGSLRVLALICLFGMMMSSGHWVAGSDDLDYAMDPIRNSYRQKPPYPEVNLQARPHFARGGAPSQEEQRVTLIRVKLQDGRRLVLEDGRPVGFKSIAPSEVERSLDRLRSASLPGTMWLQVATAPEENVVAEWKKAEAYWGEQISDPRSLYYVSGKPEEIENIALDLSRESIVEYLDIVSSDVGPARDSGVAQSASRAPGLAATAPDWFVQMNIGPVHQMMGIAGRGVTFVQNTLGVPRSFASGPPIAAFSAYGPFAPSQADDFNFAIGAFATPQATFGCVRATTLSSPVFQDFAGGLLPLIGNASYSPPLVFASDYSYWFDGGHGISVNMEWDRPTFDAIRILTANGKTVVTHAGYSHINLDDRTSYPLAPHDPFHADSGAIIVGSQVQPSNFGTRVNFIPPLLGDPSRYSSAQAIGLVAALVESALQVAGRSVSEPPPVANGGIGNRALHRLYDAQGAVRDALAGRFPRPTLRVQDTPPGNEILVHGQVRTLPDVPHNFTRKEFLRVYNDGASPLTVAAFAEVSRGTDNLACRATLGGGTVAPFSGTDLTLEIHPARPGAYECSLNLDVNDSRPAIPLSSQPGLRRWSIRFAFRVPVEPGARARVVDFLSNAVTPGQTLDFGRLAADPPGTIGNGNPEAGGPQQVKFVRIHNEPWADRNLQVTVPPYSGTTERFFITPDWPFVYSQPGGQTISIPPGDSHLFAVVARQRIALAGRTEQSFDQFLSLSTNDSGYLTFPLRVTMTLAKDSADFQMRAYANHAVGPEVSGSDWARLNLGTLSVSEGALWVRKAFGVFKALRDNIGAEWKEYTGPLDHSIEALLDRRAKPIGKLLPVQKVLQATEILDVVVEVTAIPPRIGRFQQVGQVTVRAPGKPDKILFLFLEAALAGRGPAHLGLALGPGGSQPGPNQRRTNGDRRTGEPETTADSPIGVGGTIDFGAAAVGNAVSRELVLRNDGSQTMVISDFRVDGDYTVTIPNDTIPPQTSVKILVTLTGSRRGPADGDLSFYVGGTDEADNFVALHLHGDVCEGSNCSSSQPVVSLFAMSPSIVASGAAATLTWEVANATAVEIQPGVGTVAASGTRSVTPVATTDYVLTARNGSEVVRQSAQVRVVGDGPPGSPVIESFSASPPSIAAGQSASLTWTVTGATSLSLEPGGAVTGTGTTVTPAQNATYILSASNGTGTSTRLARVTVGADAGPPVINAFSASATSLPGPGESTTLSWDVANATTVELDQGVGPVPPTGSRNLSPAVSTTYTLRARNAASATSRSVTVIVQGTGSPGAPPVIRSFVASSGAVAAGQPVTLSWVVEGADLVLLVPPLASPVATAGSQTVLRQSTTTYTLFTRNAAGSTSQNVTVTVTGGANVPEIREFAVVPTPIIVGGGGEMRWTVENAASVSIAPDVGEVPLTGTRSIHPAIDAVYVLTATNAAGSASRATVVRTTPAPPAPLNKPIEVLRGLTAENGTRLENAGTTDLYDPLRGLVAGDVPIVVVNRSSAPVTIRRAWVSNWGGGSSLASLTSTLAGITLGSGVSVPVTLRWTSPVAPRGYQFELFIELIDGTSFFHRLRLAPPTWQQEGVPGAVQVSAAGGTPVMIGYPTAPFNFTGPDDLDLGWANDSRTATKLIAVQNRTATPLVLRQAWCGHETFSVRPVPPASFDGMVPAQGSVNLRVTGVNLVYPSEQDYCYIQLQRQESSAFATHGTFVEFHVNATGVSKLPAPYVRYRDSRLTDFSVEPDGQVLDLGRLRPGRPVTITLSVQNGGGSPLQLGSSIAVSGSGFRLRRRYYESYQTRPPLTTLDDYWSDDARFDVEFVAKRAGVYSGVVKIPMWGGSRATPPYDWSRTFEIHLKATVGGGRVSVLQGATELTNGGGFDADGVTAFTVENQSAELANLSSLAVPPHYAVLSALPRSLGPGESATFTVLQTKAAAAPGPHFISFAVDDPDEPIFQVRENHRPIAVDDSLTVVGDAPQGLDVTANDIDPDGDALTLSANWLAVAPTKGGVVIDPDGVMIYTPSPGASGEDRLIYEIDDGSGGAAQAEVRIVLQTPNRAPNANPETVTTKPGRAVTVDVVANDTDPDADRILLIASPVVVPPVNGVAVKASGATITYTPNSGFSGVDSFTYEIGDSFGARARAEVTVIVANTPPNALPDIASTKPGRSVVINVTGNDGDLDGDSVVLPLNPIVIPPEQGTAVRLDSANVEYTPRAGFAGTDVFTYEVGDTFGARARATVTVSVENAPPKAGPDSVGTKPNVAVTINVTRNDTDPDGDPVVLIQSPIVVPPTNGTAVRVDAANITYTPVRDFVGTDSFTYEVGDTFGSRARAVVTVRVANSPPVALDDAATTKPGLPVTVTVTANDSDPDGDAVLLIASPIVVAPLNGTATKVDGGRIAYTPNAGFIGVDSFSYEIGDSFGARARAVVTITVANQPPVAIADAATTKPNRAVAIPVVANDTDPDGDPLSLIASPVVVPPTNGTATKVDAGTILYTPNPGFTGTDTFTYEIGDSFGARARGGVTVEVQNSAPNAVADVATTKPGRSVTINVTANDSDPDGDIVTLIASPVVIAPANGTATKLDGSSILYTPNAGFVGSDSFTYEIGDSFGARSRAIVTIVVANGPPAAWPDSVSTVHGRAILINVTANDTDPDGDAVVLIAAPVVLPPTNGTAAKVDGTTINYTPNAEFVGTDRFTYEIGDSFGARARADVTITVTNAVPVANPDVATTKKGVGVDVVVTLNDTDADGDTLSLIASPVVVAPSKGTVTKLSATTLRYVPNAGATGTDTFTYEIGDGYGGRSQASVTVTISQ